MTRSSWLGCTTWGTMASRGPPSACTSVTARASGARGAGRGGAGVRHGPNLPWKLSLCSACAVWLHGTPLRVARSRSHGHGPPHAASHCIPSAVPQQRHFVLVLLGFYMLIMVPPQRHTCGPGGCDAGRCVSHPEAAGGSAGGSDALEPRVRPEKFPAATGCPGCTLWLRALAALSLDLLSLSLSLSLLSAWDWLAFWP